MVGGCEKTGFLIYIHIYCRQFISLKTMLLSFNVMKYSPIMPLLLAEFPYRNIPSFIYSLLHFIIFSLFKAKKKKKEKKERKKESCCEKGCG